MLTMQDRQQMRVVPSLVEVEKERSKRSMAYFTRRAWPIIEPATDYVHNWHIDLIAEYLMAVTRGQIRNLIINIPPRHMKSLLVSVLFPAWVWTFAPEKRFMTASYAEGLAVRDAVKSRRIIQSQWYQERWGTIFQLTGDQNAKARYENDKAGYRISVGVGGGATGEGGDIILVDDPHKALEVDSDVSREAVISWWDETMSTRGNDPKTVVKLVIMQRVHEGDLTGHLLEKMKTPGAEQYELLCLPAEYEPKRFFSGLGLQDPRQEVGELLWEERFGPVELTKLKIDLGERGTAGQLQQSPAPAGGAIYKRTWWEKGLATVSLALSGTRFDALERAWWQRSVGRWLSWDTALKDNERNDFTALNVGELTPDYRLMLRHVWKKKMEFPELVKSIEDETKRWNYDGKLRGVLIEDKGSGTTSLQTIRQAAPEEVASLMIAFMPQGSKQFRARQASLWCERECVLLPMPNEGAPWLLDFEEVLFKFPGVIHDDEVDAFNQLVLYLENLLAEGWKLRTGVK